jgi:low temperature requirement protein LtrA
MSASYTLHSRFIPYLLLIMLFLMFIIALMLTVAIDPDPERIYLVFLLIGLFASIVVVTVWITKIQYKPREIPDYSLD